MIKRLVFSFLLAPTVSFANCGEPIHVWEPDGLIPEFYGCHINNAEPDDILRWTAFNLFSGQKKETVMQSLQSQGFTCEQNTCMKEIRDKETSFERWCGVTRIQRPRGERYWRRTIFIVGFKEESVERLADIEADFRLEQASVKWPRSPKISEFEIQYD